MKSNKNKMKTIKKLEHMQRQAFFSIKYREWKMAMARDFSRKNPHIRRKWVSPPLYQRVVDIALQIRKERSLLNAEQKRNQIKGTERCPFQVMGKKFTRRGLVDIILCRAKPGMSCQKIKELMVCPK